MSAPIDSLRVKKDTGPMARTWGFRMGNHERSPEVAAAKAIATIAHRFQVDKVGVPYIEHPCRVAAQLDDP
jgi:(p)ppGpp synthase/HD superfamily hydrolase